MLRSAGIRSKILAVLVVPLLLLGITAGLLATQQVDRARQAVEVEKIAAVGGPFADLVRGLAAERALTTASLVGSAEAGEALPAVRAQVDEGLVGARAAVADIRVERLSDQAVEALQRVETAHVQLEITRATVDRGGVTVQDVNDDYGDILREDLAMPGRVAAGLDDSATADLLTGFGHLLTARDLALREQEIGQRVLTGTATAADNAVFPSLAVGQTEELADWQFAVGSARADDVVELMGDQRRQVWTIGRARVALSSPSTVQQTGLTPEIWTEVTDGRIGGVDAALGVIAADASAAASASAQRSALLAALAVAAAVLGVGVTLVLSLVLSRRIALPVRQLTVAAGQLREQLPLMVEKMRSPGSMPDVELPHIQVDSDDEVGRLAAAFNAVNETVVEVAEEQAALRGSIAETFVNVARRNQVLLSRQLAFIDQLEQREENPDTLENLFRLDHLATRMRRNAESLLVLANIDAGRRLRQPLALSDVIRTAASEIEQYERVNLALQVDPPTMGHLSLQLAHLLAEILENGTNFSEPHTKVLVATSRTADGIRITVTDEGLGLNDEEITAAQAKISDFAADDVVTSQRLGFFVVGRLARRLHVTVAIRRGSAKGLVVTVDLPPALFVPGTVKAATPPAVAPASSAAEPDAPTASGAAPARPAAATSRPTAPKPPTARPAAPAAAKAGPAAAPKARPAAAPAARPAPPAPRATPGAPIPMPAAAVDLPPATTGQGAVTVAPGGATLPRRGSAAPAAGGGTSSPAAPPSLPTRARTAPTTPEPAPAPAPSAHPAPSAAAGAETSPEENEHSSRRSGLFGAFRARREMAAQPGPAEATTPSDGLDGLDEVAPYAPSVPVAPPAPAPASSSVPAPARLSVVPVEDPGTEDDESAALAPTVVVRENSPSLPTRRSVAAAAAAAASPTTDVEAGTAPTAAPEDSTTQDSAKQDSAKQDSAKQDGAKQDGAPDADAATSTPAARAPAAPLAPRALAPLTPAQPTPAPAAPAPAAAPVSLPTRAPAVEAPSPTLPTRAPAVKADAPVHEPDAPAVKADAPAAKADAPVQRADAPAAKADAPVQKADAPATKAEPATPEPEARRHTAQPMDILPGGARRRRRGIFGSGRAPNAPTPAAPERAEAPASAPAPVPVAGPAPEPAPAAPAPSSLPSRPARVPAQASGPDRGPGRPPAGPGPSRPLSVLETAAGASGVPVVAALGDGEALRQRSMLASEALSELSRLSSYSPASVEGRGAGGPAPLTRRQPAASEAARINVPTEPAPQRRERSAADVRSMLSGFQSGVTRGRAGAEDADDPGAPAPSAAGLRETHPVGPPLTARTADTRTTD